MKSTKVRITQETSYFLKVQIVGLYNEQVLLYIFFFLDNNHPENLHEPSYYSR